MILMFHTLALLFLEVLDAKTFLGGQRKDWKMPHNNNLVPHVASKDSQFQWRFVNLPELS
jgi:hypothetical protein